MPDSPRTLFKKIEEQGIELRYETAATKLLVDVTGKVCGVAVRNKNIASGDHEQGGYFVLRGF